MATPTQYFIHSALACSHVLMLKVVQWKLMTTDRMRIPLEILESWILPYHYATPASRALLLVRPGRQGGCSCRLQPSAGHHFVNLQAQIQTVLAAVLRCARPLGGHGGEAAAKHAVLQLRK